MAELSWVGISLLTGRILADLPGITMGDDLAVTIGQPESVGVSLNLAKQTNPDWFAATKPGATALIAYTGDQSNPNVMWGGIVTQRVRDTTWSVSLGLQTAEAYLDAAYVGDYAATSLNQDTIVSDLMGFASGANRPPWTLAHVSPSTFLQTVKYAATDQVTVLSALQNLSAISGGPEWTISWSWNLAAGTIKPTFTYGSRIGSPVASGRQPNVTIETADLIDGSNLTEDYTSGYGANDITATGAPPANATSGSVPSASATSSDLNGRPLWSYSYQPDSTQSDPTILADYAEQALSRMTDGASPLSLVIANDVPGKRLGVDWFIGDDIGFSLTGVAFPDAPSGITRVIGYQVGLATVTPILQSVGGP